MSGCKQTGVLQLFDRFWEECVQIEADELIARNRDSLVLALGAEQNVRAAFVCFCEDIHNRMQAIHRDVSTASTLGRKLMDRHKIAACVAAAILQAGVCERTRDVPSNCQPLEVRLANEILAFQCALHVLYSYLSHESGYRLEDVAQLDSEVLERIGREGFLMPPTYEGAESYEMHLLKAMRISKGLRFDGKIPPMDILLYSAILYHIELHNFEKPLFPRVG